MKQKVPDLRNIILMILMFLPQSVFPQSTIFKSDQMSEFSIIRNHKENTNITYNDYYGTDISFNYVDLNTQTTRSVDIGSFLRVHDFAVYDDSVFFCGRGIGLSGAVCGFFDINDVFFGYGTITYFNPFIPNESDPSVNKLNVLSKIDVIRSAANETHMFMTGEGYLFDIDAQGRHINIRRPSVIVDFWTDASSVPKIKCTIDQTLRYSYSDVTITEQNGIVATISRDTGNAHEHIIFAYNNPVLPNESFLDSWTGGGNISNTPLLRADHRELMVGSILVTKMDGSKFATICNNTYTNKLTMSLYNDPFNPPFLRFELPSKDRVYEFVFNPRREAFYCASLFQSSNFGLISTKSPYTHTQKEEDFAYNRWQTIDNDIGQNTEIMSGCNIGEGFVKKYWSEDPDNPSRCVELEVGENIVIAPNDQTDYYRQEIEGHECTPSVFNVKSKNYSIWILCQ